VGSNIFNILGVLGLSALVAPLAVSRRLVRLDVPILIALSAAVYVLGLDGRVSRVEGALLVAAGVAYTVFAVRTSRADAPPLPAPPGAHPLAAGVVRVVAGLALLALGARWLVESAVALARGLGIGELVIGLTIVAVGTSLPEVAASVVAAWRGERDIAVGNAVGSNIFNILSVLGLTAAVSRAGVPVAPAALALDIPVMVAVAGACLPLFFTGLRIGRGEGALLVGYYAAYAAFLVLAAQRHAALPLYSTTMALFVLPLTAVTIGVLAWREARRRA
jgi:cation:H+ antiporter